MIRLGVIGAGAMGHGHARIFSGIRGCKVTACCDVDADKIQAFAKQYKIPDIYTDYRKLLAKAEVDAVSVATPDPFHASISIAAAKVGKHVFCEKPLATSYPEARTMLKAVKRAGVINMINFSYRDSPAIQKAAKIIQAGQLGAVRHIQADYLQGWLTGNFWGDWHHAPAWLWRLSTRHGSSGALGDVAVHIIDFATFPAGPLKSVHCRLKTLPKAPRNRVGKFRLDANDTAIITAEFANGAVGSITATRWATGHPNTLKLGIYCEKGALEVDLDRSWNSLMICRGKDVHTPDWKELRCPKTLNNYQRFIKSIQTGLNDQPNFARGADIQKILDACTLSDQEDKTIRVF